LPTQYAWRVKPLFFTGATAAADLKPGTLARGFGAWWVSSDCFDFSQNSFHQIVNFISLFTKSPESPCPGDCTVFPSASPKTN